ncbi:cellulose binding domain-containing protein [Microbulbifer sp. THAF38]|uniref:cellulose binding domain-containing protein n=1 Tax=Microbulbifer sp. THAF38 TaxID=2587856 RepID=UPI00126980B0|nr:cellulose binding domain-containing protein [Microbulbifer sp. THAF38]QFT54274.1 Endoglucanase E1 precursor [Microbulbifer sp. THAF38]
MRVRFFKTGLTSLLLLGITPFSMAATNCEVNMVVQSQWDKGYMASVMVRNTGTEPINGWNVSWQWPGDQVIDGSWNAKVSQSGNAASAEGTGDFANIPVGEARSFGFNIAYSGGAQVPAKINASCDSQQIPKPTTPAEPTKGNTPLSDLESYNYILGTQTISPKYSFTGEGSLVESAKAIRAMGSNLLKIALSTGLYDELRGKGLDYQFKRMLEEVPAYREVLDMDFSHYMFWVEDSGSWMDNKGMSQEELTWQYDKIYAMAEYLLTQYSGSGKTFMIGHWEGDWNLVQKADGTRDDSQQKIDPLRIQGLIDWLNIRQKAIEDAKANVPHSNVNLYHYVEVNRVESAMQGKERITNAVLPHTNVDLVSYSAYDLTTKEKHSDFATLHAELTKALDFIDSKLPHKAGLPFEKRVFIGEYGYGESWFKDWGTRSGEAQDMLSRNVIKTSLEWGSPFILYWQMYGNEYDSWINEFVGYWLIDNNGNKKEIYHTHENFYKDAKSYLNNYQAKQGKLPSESEFRAFALKWFESSATATPDNNTTTPPTTPTTGTGTGTGTGTDPTPTTPDTQPQASGQCTVEYSIQDDWGNGFMANIVIRNTGSQPLDAWQIQWQWPGNQKVTNFWNAKVVDHSGSVTASGQDTIPPGEARAFGFNGEYSGTNSKPTLSATCQASSSDQAGTSDTSTSPNTATQPSGIGNSAQGETGKIKLWFIGDSITYGMTTLPYNSMGFRSQIWQHIVEAADGKSNFPLSSSDNNGALTISYNGQPVETIGTVSGPTGPDGIEKKTGNYWHTGIPGASTSDMLCFLNPTGHQIPAGYSSASCADSIAYFNSVVIEMCRESGNSAGWLDNQACQLNQNLETTDAVIVPIQLGTNDITHLNRSGATQCSSTPQAGSTTAKKLDQVVASIVSTENIRDNTTLVGKIYGHLNTLGIPNDKIAFVISTIPRRTNLDGQDPSNHCTDYYNTKIKSTVASIAPSTKVFLADQGNIVPTGDSVHPTTAGHKVMACNLLYGYNYGHSESFHCPIPGKIPNTGLLRAFAAVSAQ